MSGQPVRLRNVAQLVARQLRDKLLILLELRDFPRIAHACAGARGLSENTKSPMLFRVSPETQATSTTYRATNAQPSRNHTISRATKEKGVVLWG
jgi:hypothetical protein